MSRMNSAVGRVWPARVELDKQNHVVRMRNAHVNRALSHRWKQGPIFVKVIEVSKGFMNLFRGKRNGERRPAAAAARLPLEGRPPSADRSIEFRSTLLTRLDSPALVARATRRGRLSARQW